MSDITKGYTFNDNEQVTADKLNNLVDNATINTGAVGSDDLAVDAVTASKIANDAVTTDKVQDGAITRDKLAEDAMGVKSIQKGVEAANSTTKNITISSVDPDKSFVILNGGAEDRAGTGEGDSVQYNPWVNSLSATNLEVKFQQVGDGGSFSWQVVEFY